MINKITKYLKQIAIATTSVMLVTGLLYGGAQFSRVTVWSSAQTLTAASLNGEFDNILTNLTPAGIDDESVSLVAMRATVDPYPAGTESLATALQGEIQRIRYLLAQITGETYWYIDPDTTIAALKTAADATAISHKNYIAGLVLSNDTDTEHDISIAAGCALDSTNAYMMTLGTAMVKRIDAGWAAGTAAGGMFTGSVGATTWYHVFLIRKTADGSIDAGFDTSVTAANIPAGYVAYRRIGSVLTDGASNIVQFIQHGDNFTWKTLVQDLNGITPANTNAVTQALTVPTGVSVQAHVNGVYYYVSGDATYLLLTELGETDTTPSATACDVQPSTSMVLASFNRNIWTNASAQIRYRCSSTTTTLTIFTRGWKDLRGQN
jgi:hypothetical protein